MLSITGHSFKQPALAPRFSAYAATYSLEQIQSAFQRLFPSARPQLEPEQCFFYDSRSVAHAVRDLNGPEKDERVRVLRGQLAPASRKSADVVIWFPNLDLSGQSQANALNQLRQNLQAGFGMMFRQYATVTVQAAARQGESMFWIHVDKDRPDAMRKVAFGAVLPV